MPCAWCGEDGTADNPVLPTVTAPPVDGYVANEEYLHRKCADEYARERVR